MASGPTSTSTGSMAGKGMAKRVIRPLVREPRATAPSLSHRFTEAARRLAGARRHPHSHPARCQRRGRRPAPMTQTSNRLFDELARLMTDAANVAQGVRREASTAFRSQADRLITDLDLVRR